MAHRRAWLNRALELNRVLDAHYGDTRGCYFMTADDHEALLAREKPSYDGARPSGNSVQLLNLLRLYEFTTNKDFRQRAVAALRAFGAQLANSPSSLSEMLSAVDYYLDAPKEILIVAPDSPQQASPLLSVVRKQFVPNRVLAVVSQGAMLEAHQTVIPFLEHKIARYGEATAYVCERGVCELPTTKPSVFSQQLQKVERLAR